MKKKFSLIIVFLSIISISCISFSAFGAFANTQKISDSSVTLSREITALTPKDGESVSLINPYIETLYRNFDGDYSKISGLFNVTDEMATFTSILGDKEAVRALYTEWDDFKPINNVLKWEFDGEAESFSVVVSKDSDLSTYVFKATTEEKEVLLDNVLYPNEEYFWQVKASVSGEEVVSRIFEFSTKDTIRTVDIDGVSNTRDIGGFDSLYGKTVNGLVYRGARLDDISEKGIGQMNALGIKSDIDLRQLNEGAENPSDRENNYAYLDSPMYLEIFEEDKKENLRNIISLFANPDNYPVYFHCAVGRDRTGTISFLLNNLLGVSQKDVLCEYLTSMFSVTGSLSVSKESDDLLQALNGMYIMLDAYEGENYSEKTENFLLSIGVTKAEIDAIRDIMTGKTEILAWDEENEDGYGERAIVTFISFGKAEQVFAVNKGDIVSAPYELDEGYVWTVNGIEANFDLPITEDTRFEAKRVEGFTVTFVIDGEMTEKFYQRGVEIEFSQFEKEGYTFFVISDSGDILTSLTVERNIAINVIYIKK